jgi:hypothetical protein
LGPLTVGTFTALLTPVVWLGGYVQDGTTQAVLIGLPAAGVSTAFLDLIGSGSALTFSLTYLTAAP